jgi:cytoskeletal protein CcmA (bactofilin family)
MNSDKHPKSDAENEKPTAEPEKKQQAPVDALSRTPEDLAMQDAKDVADLDELDDKVEKLPAYKRFFRTVNVYMLIFILILAVTAVVTVVNYLNATKAPVQPTIANQNLTEDSLKQLANSDTSVGNNSQTLTIQGNAIIQGQTLTRGNLNVVGNIQTGGSIQGPNLVISGTSNLGTAQINSLQVATNTTIQGNSTVNGNLNVAGTSSFNGAITASQITVTNLILSGNAILQVPNHVAFDGPAPVLAPTPGVLGSGGTASIKGSDTSGTVNISTGNNPTPGCLAQITFRQKYTDQPYVNISPIGPAAGQTQYYVTRNNTSFSICTANAAPANQSFAFDYFIAG